MLYRRTWLVSLLSIFISVYILFKAVFYLAQQALFSLDISVLQLVFALWISGRFFE